MMIDHLDNLLRHLLLEQVDGLSSEDQIRFQPPDELWRNYVKGLNVNGQPANALNVYLTDLRENRKLRSNARIRSMEDHTVREQMAHARIDCHYLISAWSPATITVSVEPAIDEHALLYQTTAALLRNTPLNPSHAYPSGSAALSNWPEPFRETDLPTTVAPAEGFSKLAEFWNGMGAGARWKPVLYLIVTLPVALLEFTVPWVTTRITEYRKGQVNPMTEVRIQIGGRVLDTTGSKPAPVSAAWVQLQRPSGEALQNIETDGQGHFTFSGLEQGSYVLRVRAPGFTEKLVPIGVPSSTGDYDISLN